MAGRLGRYGWVIAGCVLLVVVLHALGLHLLGRMLPGSVGPEAGEITQTFITRSLQLGAAPSAPQAAQAVPKAPRALVPMAAGNSAPGVPNVQEAATPASPAPLTATPAAAPAWAAAPALLEPNADASASAAAVANHSAASAPAAASAAAQGGGASGGSGVRPLPVYSYVIPASTRLKYDVSGTISGFKYYVGGELLWLQDGSNYSARLGIRHFLLGSRVQTSKGLLTAQGLEPKRFSDKTRSEVAAHFERDKGKVSFSANTPDVALLPMAQDQLSVFIQLAAIWAAQGQRPAPGSQMSFQAVGARTAEQWTFEVGETETLRIDDKPWPAHKLTRERSGDFDTRVELWLAPALDYLPVRIRLTQSNGDEVDMVWSSTEKP